MENEEALEYDVGGLLAANAGMESEEKTNARAKSTVKSLLRFL
jgi:hypothetical protein